MSCVHMVGFSVLLFWVVWPLLALLILGNVNLNLTYFWSLETRNLNYGYAMLYFLTLNVMSLELFNLYILESFVLH